MQTHLPLETDVLKVAEKIRCSESFLLLDVREEVEFATARIESSRLIPMSELGERVEELEPHRRDLIIVYCHHGVRSLQVTQALRNAGFDKVQSMAGGIDQWSVRVDASVPRY